MVTGSRSSARSGGAEPLDPERRDWLAVGLTTLLVGLWAWRPLWDIDLFWHVVVGRLILDGGVPTQDVLSAADPTAPWHTFQWGYEVLVAVIDSLGGLWGLKLFHWALFTSTAAAFMAALRAKGLPRAPSAGMLGVALLLVEDRLRARPHLFELLFVLALMPVLLRDPQRPPPSKAAELQTPLMLVLLAGLWFNLHAVSALWWVALVGAWVVDRPSLVRGSTLAGGLLVGLGGGPARRGLIGAFSSHRSWPAELVPELQPTWAYGEAGAFGWAMLAGTTLGLLAAGHLIHARAYRRGPLLAALGTGIAALLMARWAWLSLVPLTLWALWRRPSWLPVAGALAFFGLAAHTLPRWSLEDRAQVLEPGRFPVQACQQLSAHQLRVPLDTTPGWSGYLLYCLYPGGRVLADGRMVFGPQVTTLLLDREAGDLSTFDRAVGQFHTQALVWPTETSPPLDPSRWRRVHQDPVAEIWLPKPMWGLW